MSHTSDIYVLYGDLLWPDLDLETRLLSNIYSISTLPYIIPRPGGGLSHLRHGGGGGQNDPPPL